MKRINGSCLVLAALVLAATPLFAQTAKQSEKQVEENWQVFVRVQRFALLREPKLLEGLEAVVELYWPLFQKAEQQTGIPALWLASSALVESNANPLARSHRDAGGINQFITSTARKYDLKGPKCLELGRKGKRQVCTEWSLDQRFIPELSIPAAAEYFKDLRSSVGDMRSAVWAYHCGPGCVKKAQNLAQGYGLVNLNVRDLLIQAHPVFTPELYNYLHKYASAKHDFSVLYPATTEAAGQIIQEFKQNKAEVRLLWQAHQNPKNTQLDPKLKVKNRYQLWTDNWNLFFPRMERVSPSVRNVVSTNSALPFVNLKDPSILGLWLELSKRFDVVQVEAGLSQRSEVEFLESIGSNFLHSISLRYPSKQEQQKLFDFVLTQMAREGKIGYSKSDEVLNVCVSPTAYARYHESGLAWLGQGIAVTASPVGFELCLVP